MRSTPELNPSPSRLRVYHYLVDGLGVNSGICAASIPAELAKEGIKISKQGVDKHVKALEEERFVARIRGTRNPVVYIRGERATLLDDIIGTSSQPRVNPPCDGGRNVQNWRQPDNNTPVYIPKGEAHIDGRFIFPVLKIGELYSPFLIKDDTGEQRSVMIFEKEPKQLNNGVHFYRGLVPLEDGNIKIQFWEGPEEVAMHIWPTPVELFPGHKGKAEQDLVDKAQLAANFLGRFGGWQLGLPRFVGDTHYATNDPAIMANFPLGFQPAAGSGYRIDSTPGPRALEVTSDEEKAQAVINFHGITKDLKANVSRVESKVDGFEEYKAKVLQRLDFMDHRADRLEHFLDRLESSNERIAANVHSIIEREAGQVAEKLEPDPGVMFG